jgi:hypothetical protein
MRQRGTITPARYDVGSSTYCGPTSLSAITGHGTGMVTKWVRDTYRLKCVKGMRVPYAIGYLKAKGYTVDRVWGRYANGRCTLGRFVDFHARPRDVYLVNVTGHYLVLHAGKVVCTSSGGQIRPASANKHLRRQVVNAWRVS